MPVYTKSQHDRLVVPPQIQDVRDVAVAVDEVLTGLGCRVVFTADYSTLTAYLEDGRAVRIDLELSEGRIGEPAPITNDDDDFPDAPDDPRYVRSRLAELELAPISGGAPEPFEPSEADWEDYRDWCESVDRQAALHDRLEGDYDLIAAGLPVG